MTSPLASAGAAITRKLEAAEKRALLLSNSGTTASKVADLGDALKLLAAYPSLPRDLRNGASQLGKDSQGRPQEDHMTSAAVVLEKAPEDALALFMMALKVIPAEKLKTVETALRVPRKN